MAQTSGKNRNVAVSQQLERSVRDLTNLLEVNLSEGVVQHYGDSLSLEATAKTPGAVLNGD